MNYRHTYHAGNFADVLKHAVLALVVEHAKLKPSAFRILDTHAGIGRYDLTSIEAGKTGEWRTGIGRLLAPETEPIPEPAARLLAPYLDVVRAENPRDCLTFYPGSPLLARRLMRPQDRLTLTELHPDDARMLKRRFVHDKQTGVIELDGWLALRAYLPPKERRGVILIDPPYETPDELRMLANGLHIAVQRFPSGTYLLWYPIKDTAQVERFHDAIHDLGVPKVLRAEIRTRSATDNRQLSGCGLMIVNPPWTLPNQLDTMLPFLAERLAIGEGSGFTLQWVAE